MRYASYSLVLLMSACRFSSAADLMHAVEAGGYEFQVCQGYQLELIAGPGLISRPTVCDWDDDGRLVVCESSGTHEGTKKQLETTPHKLVRLIDDDDDGVFDRRIIAAEGLSFYSGVLCEGDDVYVSTPPNILKLTDADGDGVCESREVWHDGGTLTYCANDLHGPYKGPDGWIYWCKGAFGEQTHQLADGQTLKSSAAHILRKRPEGGPVEIVISGGMDNPIELAFLPSGDLFFTSTFLHHPSGGIRDGIGHAVYGSVFGKRHQVIDGLPRTGDLMPVMTELGAAAPSGLTRLAIAHSDENVLACAQFNLHKVSRHRLSRSGATFMSLNEDLVTSKRLTFHPTDVIEDRDGSLVILDTGDWYDLCCPSSGAESSKATGGVYRLTRMNETSEQLTPIGGGDDDDVDLLVAKLNQLSRIVPTDLTMVVETLKESSDPAVVRAAAECIGHHGDAGNVPAVFSRLAEAANDRTLEHSLLYAAMQIGDAAAIESFVREDKIALDPSQLRGAILLLDQMDADRLDPKVVFAAAFSEDDRLHALASDTLRRHADWAATLLPSVSDRWANATSDDEILNWLSAWQAEPSVREWMLVEISGGASSDRRAAMLTQMSFEEFSNEWDAATTLLMMEAKPDDQARIANWLVDVPLTEQNAGTVSQLLTIMEKQDLPVQHRLQMAAALPSELPPRVHGISDVAVEVLLSSADSDEQLAAQAALQRSRLDASAAQRLLTDLDKIPTARFSTATAAIARADEALAARLLKRLKEIKTARTLSPEMLVGLYSDRDVDLHAEAKKVAEQLSAPPADVAESLAKLMADLPDGDMVRGMRVFHGEKAACGKCHEFGDVGGRVGPELTGIGKSRSRSALLEAIVYPSSHIAQGYRGVKVLTVDGVVHSGLVTGETDESIELTTGIDRVVRLLKSDIDEREDSDVSIMPAGLEGSMSKQELADVMELLEVYSAW